MVRDDKWAYALRKQQIQLAERVKHILLANADLWQIQNLTEQHKELQKELPKLEECEQSGTLQCKHLKQVQSLDRKIEILLRRKAARLVKVQSKPQGIDNAVDNRHYHDFLTRADEVQKKLTEKLDRHIEHSDQLELDRFIALQNNLTQIYDDFQNKFDQLGHNTHNCKSTISSQDNQSKIDAQHEGIVRHLRHELEQSQRLTQELQTAHRNESGQSAERIVQLQQELQKQQDVLQTRHRVEYAIRLAELEAELNQLKLSNADLRNQLGKTIQENESDRTTYLNEIQLVHQTNSASERQIYSQLKPLQDQIETLTNQLLESQESNRTLNSELKKIQKKKSQTNDQLSVVSSEIETLQQRLKDKERTTLNLQNQLTKLEESARTLESQLEESGKVVASTKEQGQADEIRRLNELQLVYQRSGEAGRQLRMQLATLQTDITQVTDRLTKSEETNKNLEIELARKTNDLNRNGVHTSSDDNDIQRLQQVLAERERTEENLQLQLAKLQTDANSLRSELKDVKQDRDNRKKEYENAWNHMRQAGDRLQRENDELTQQLSHQNAQHEQRIDALMQTNAQL